jgi:hypothetical protein
MGRMNSSNKNPFDDLPGFEETISRIARVPSPLEKKPSEEFSYAIVDETHKITYRIVSQRVLTAGDIRRALVKAFSRKDNWPNAPGEVDIRI